MVCFGLKRGSQTVQITDFEYLDDLHLVRNKQGDGKLFYLDREYSVRFMMDDEPIIYTVPKETWTDFASIPRFFARYIETLGPHIEAAVVHDHICQTRPWTSDIAADIFYAGLLAADAPKAWQMWKAVKWAGPSWG